MKFQKQHKENKLAILGKEKSLIERNFSFLKCKIEDKVLYCYGTYKPTELSVEYKYRIKYDAISKPIVQLRDPKIEYDDNIHMYPEDNSLCLYHKTDLIWSSKTTIYNTIIPWTHEWLIFYELYKITGKWEHPSVEHKKNEKTNKNK